MNHSEKPVMTHSRPQFRLGSLMIFTAGLCAISAVLAAMHIHPLQLLVAVAWFSTGVVFVVVPLELAFTAVGVRQRQQHERQKRD